MTANSSIIRENQRLEESRRGLKAWKKWGPYLSERQWGTVREDYSADGNAWGYFPHDHTRSRAYRWGEDGIAGISDDKQLLCFAVALWNGRDPILKERLFGLTGPEGNHGEDVKELYQYLDATPTNSYLKILYKYPQAAYPYAQLVEENRRRGKQDREFELIDTGVFEGDRYFDVFVEYAKGDSDDIVIKITVHNRGPEAAVAHVVPQMWFRNTWSWEKDGAGRKPVMTLVEGNAVRAEHAVLGMRMLYAEPCAGVVPTVMFTENETNVRRLWNQPVVGHFKDAFHEAIVRENSFAVNAEKRGTKVGVHYALNVGAGQSVTVRLRLTDSVMAAPFGNAATVLGALQREADAFYEELQANMPERDRRLVQRQPLAGMLWSKQFYYFDVEKWQNGDSAGPVPPASRVSGRNCGWEHLNNGDVISMPDKWEYPWYAAWDLAFHCVPLSLVDAEFAKEQLVLLTREWYMHPNGQLPAYEWQFGDVNPPVHAWATWRVFEMEKRRRGDKGDVAFLERVFHKLLLNFTWWVNRKDVSGRNIFQGGFLGLDNIGVFDRSAPLPTGGHINQSDGTSWMGMYSLNMLRIALELAMHNPVYEDVASKFFEHFLYIAAAMRNVGGTGIDLWDNEDEFFYDVLSWPDGKATPLKVRSLVGLIPLLAVEVLDAETLAAVPGFKRRLEWMLTNKPELAQQRQQMRLPIPCTPPARHQPRNAGIQADSPFDKMTLEQWNRVMSVNLTGQFLCAREAVREFKRRGVVPDVSCAAGKIICMSSVHDVIPWAGHVNYAASKGGVMLMMKSIAQEVAPFRIRVNSISPGAIRTPINMEAWSTPEAYADLMKLVPYKRIGEPADIERAAIWLASDDADYVTGATIYVDGGMTLYPGFETGG